jgi:superfamily II DNA or RNA helicase
MTSTGLIRQARSWEHFKVLVAALPTTKAKGDVFELLCAAFLRTDPRYAAELAHVWLLREVPHRLAKQLDLPKTDEGIDGIAQTHDGDFWSFQCKYLDDPQTTLTKNALVGFSQLSLTNCKGITKAIVLHTSAAPIRKHKLLRISEVGLREWEALEGKEWAAVASAAVRSRHPKPKPRTPRPHQAAAVKAIARHLKTHDRGRVLMACGSGKSLVGFWAQSALKARQVVVAVPSLSLLNQTLREWATEWAARGETVRYTAVCGDESAADLGDSFVGHAYELGIDTYTDPKLIAERLKALRNTHHVVFTTYQSSHKLAAAASRAKTVFDLAILDEAHKTVGQRGDRFTTLLDERKIRIGKRIAMTATERVLRGEHDDVLSMDDPEMYGEVAFSYTFKEAIADGVICDYKVVTLAVSESRIRELIKNNANLLLKGKGHQDRARLAQDLAAGELLAKGLDEFGVRHAISFHRSIAAASGFRDQWEAVGRLVDRRVHSAALHVSSKVSTGQRVQLLREFRESEAALITNARCLTEGVDVPNVDAVLFADPRRSTVDIVQAVGRALRKSAQKPHKIGYVLLPVLVKDGQTVDQFLESSAFKEIGRVIATLSTHDERIAEEFRAHTGDARRRRGRNDSRILFTGDVPVGVSVDAAEFAEKCRARVWQRVGRLNWRPFEEAREWARGTGFQSQTEWSDFCAGRSRAGIIRPSDIPVAPSQVYRLHGWTSWGDWLGTGNVAWSERHYLPYDEARSFVHALKLRSMGEWAQYCKGQLVGKPPLPAGIPASVYSVYKGRGWVSMGDWLGTGRIAKQHLRYRAFTAARSFARSLALGGVNDWTKYCRGLLRGKPPLPSDVPRHPSEVYRDRGWKGMGDWLGTGTVAKQNRRYRRFTLARAFARSLQLKSGGDWQDYCAGRIKGRPPLPQDIPAAVYVIYKNRGWKGMGDWLGTTPGGRAFGAFRSFEDSRRFARSLKLRSKSEWAEYCRGAVTGKPPLPRDIPKDPRSYYGDQDWTSWGDWLGTGAVATFNRRFKSFAQARAFVHKLRLTSRSDWSRYCKTGLPGKPPLPPDVPAAPSRTFKDEWRGWGDWLGTGTVAVFNRKYRSFGSARRFARSLRLASVGEWRAYAAGVLNGSPRKPHDIPSNPNNVYAGEGWSGFSDWLGNGRKARRDSPHKGRTK